MSKPTTYQARVLLEMATKLEGADRQIAVDGFRNPTVVALKRLGLVEVHPCSRKDVDRPSLSAIDPTIFHRVSAEGWSYLAPRYRDQVVASWERRLSKYRRLEESWSGRNAEEASRWTRRAERAEKVLGFLR